MKHSDKHRCIREAYIRYLGRMPSDDEVAYHSESPLPVGDVISHIQNSEEALRYKNRPKGFHSFPVKIVVTFRNIGRLIEKTIQSIREQSDPDWSAVVIDDASEDDSLLRARDVIGNDPRFVVVSNPTRVFQLANIVSAIRHHPPHDQDTIVITVDGGDWLASSSVVKTVRFYHRSFDITWGQYVVYPSMLKGNSAPVPPPGSRVCDLPFLYSHLRTFKQSAFYDFDHRLLKDDNGQYFRAAGDMALMLPLLDLSGHSFSPVDSVLYVYNDASPHADRKDQLRAEDLIRQRVKGKSRRRRARHFSSDRGHFAFRSGEDDRGTYLECEHRKLDMVHPLRDIYPQLDILDVVSETSQRYAQPIIHDDCGMLATTEFLTSHERVRYLFRKIDGRWTQEFLGLGRSPSAQRGGKILFWHPVPTLGGSLLHLVYAAAALHCVRDDFQCFFVHGRANPDWTCRHAQVLNEKTQTLVGEKWTELSGDDEWVRWWHENTPDAVIYTGNVGMPLWVYDQVPCFYVHHVYGEWYHGHIRSFAKRIFCLLPTGDVLDHKFQNPDGLISEPILNAVPDPKIPFTLKESRNHLVYGFYSSFQHRKNVGSVISAYSSMNENGDRLIIAGQGTPSEVALVSSQIRKSRCTSISLVENISNAYAIMRDMDVLVFPSIFEGYPQVLIEAGLLGLPIISLRFDNRRTGYSDRYFTDDMVFYVDELDELQEAMKAMRDFDLRKRLSGNMMDFCQRHHRLPVLGHRLASLLSDAWSVEDRMREKICWTSRGRE